MSSTTLLSPRTLVARKIPRQVLARGKLPIPRGTVTRALFWRVLFEVSLLRYVGALLPFLIAMAIWPESAFGLAQAPLPMFLLVYVIETRVLAMPNASRRQALVTPAEADAGLDLLTQRARKVLSRIAAGRQIATGRLHLVVEQSPMARVTPLTILSVQPEEGASFLDLSAPERALLMDLFDDVLSERRLQRINLAQNTFLRAVAFEARAVTAHARLAALAAEAIERPVQIGS
ncbi:MAG: hypothetical protein AAGE13_10705 [Pseudomonadota bacterium]